MIALGAIGLALLLLKATGGTLSQLSLTSLPHQVAVMLLFIAQGILRGRIPFANAGGTLALLAWSAMCIALIVLLRGQARPGIGLVAAGIAANLAVVLLNGAMPVAVASPHLQRLGSFYRAASPATVAVILADALPAPGGLILSLGDLLLLVGMIVFIVAAGASGSAPNMTLQE